MARSPSTAARSPRVCLDPSPEGPPGPSQNYGRDKDKGCQESHNENVRAAHSEQRRSSPGGDPGESGGQKPPRMRASTETIMTPPRADPGPRAMRSLLVFGSVARARFQETRPSTVNATPGKPRIKTQAGLPDMAETKPPARSRRGPDPMALLHAAVRVPCASANCRRREGALGGLTRASSGEVQSSSVCAVWPTGKGVERSCRLLTHGF